MFIQNFILGFLDILFCEHGTVSACCTAVRFIVPLLLQASISRQRFCAYFGLPVDITIKSRLLPDYSPAAGHMLEIG